MSNIDDLFKNFRENLIVKPIPMTKKEDIESMVEMISATEAKKFLEKSEEVNLNRFIEEFNEAVSNACEVEKNYVKFPDHMITQKKRDLIKKCGYDVTYDMQSDETLVSW